MYHHKWMLLLVVALCLQGSFAAKWCNNHDVVFLIDESKSVNNDEFELQMDFVEDLIRTFPIGPQTTHVGLVTFDIDAEHEFFLTSYYTLSEILNHTAAIKPDRKNRSHIHLGLQYVFDQLKDEGREEAKKVVIAIADGVNGWSLNGEEIADSIHKLDAIVIVIPVRPRHGVLDDVIESIATDPIDQHIFPAGGWDELPSPLTISEQICPTYEKPDCSKYGPGWIGSPVTNSCYMFVKKDLTCAKARRWCKRKSTNVQDVFVDTVRIETAAENAWLLAQIHPRGGNYWINAETETFDWGKTVRVYWADCKLNTIQWENFLAGEPTGVHDEPEECVYMQSKDGYWNDAPRRKTIKFICEIPLIEEVECSGTESVAPSLGPTIVEVCLVKDDKNCTGWDGAFAINNPRNSMTCHDPCVGTFRLYQ